MAASRKIPVDPARNAEFERAFELLTQLVDLRQIDGQFPLRGNAVYCNSVVLWMLVYQRMNPDSSLEAAVKELIQSQPDLLPRNKRLTEGTLSTNTGAYSKARSRLPLSAARSLTERVSQSLIDATPPSLDGRRMFLVDGTTITLAPEPELRQEFPPASNQYGTGVWPVALLVVAHELASGAALLPEVGPQYGPQAVSETALVRDCLRRLPEQSIVMADAGFGIFMVAHAAVAAGHNILFRQTKQRFESLRKQTQLVESGSNWNTYVHQWRPSKKERDKHGLPPEAVLSVHLHEITINSELTLYLVTDLPHDVWTLAEIYERRVDVETDIRNLKVVLDTENLRARSLGTFYKELYASMVSYNLVIQFRRQAAELAQVAPRRLSFKRTWTTFRTFLLSAMYTDEMKWRDQYALALGYAQQDKLPNRPGRRYPREVYKRRPKSHHFKKRKPKPDTE